MRQDKGRRDTRGQEKAHQDEKRLGKTRQDYTKTRGKDQDNFQDQRPRHKGKKKTRQDKTRQDKIR
jgi:hypothetical protein